MFKEYDADYYDYISEIVIRPGGLRITDEAIYKCEFRKDSRILDVGCGAGTTVEYINKRYGYYTVGIDRLKENIEKGKQREPNLNVTVGDASELGYGSDTFDGVFMECSLSVIERKEEALREAYRVLESGGKLVISDVYSRNPDSALTSQPRSCCMNDPFHIDELIKVIEGEGFKVTQWVDKTDELKQYLVEMIMKYGSVEEYFKCTSSCQNKDGNIVKAAKLGYFLILAEKQVK